MLSIDGSTGEVFIGEIPVVPSPVVVYLEEGMDAAVAGVDESGVDLVQAVDRLLRHADSVRRMAVRANADSGEDAGRARRMGAQGIGLCRIEHMFLGDRRVMIERVILADTAAERERRSTRSCRRSARTSRRCSGDGRPARRSACSTRRCTSSRPTART